MAAHGCTVTRLPRHNRRGAVTPGRIAHDTVTVALRVITRVDELAGLDRGIVTAAFENFLEEQHGTLLDLARLGLQRSVLPEFELLVNAVDTHQRLPGAVDPGDVVVMPGDVAPFIGGDRALDIGRGQARDQGIEHVRDRGFQRVRFHVARILLGAEPVTGEQLAQRNRVGQIQSQFRCRRRGRRHRG